MRAYFICVVLFTSLSALAQPVVNVACFELPPFFMGLDNGLLTEGTGVERLSEAFGRLSKKVRVINMPLPRALESVSSGINDAFCLVTKPDPSLPLVFANTPYLSTTAVFFRRNTDQWEYSGIDSLRYRRLVSVKGYDVRGVDESLSNYLERPNPMVLLLYGESVSERSLKLLISGRADLALMSIHQGNYVAEQLGIKSQLAVAAGFEVDVGLYLGFAPHMADLVGEFDKVLKESDTERPAGASVTPSDTGL